MQTYLVQDENGVLGIRFVLPNGAEFSTLWADTPELSKFVTNLTNVMPIHDFFCECGNPSASENDRRCKACLDKQLAAAEHFYNVE